MNFKIEFHPEAKKEFDSLDGSLKKPVLKQIKKLQTSPFLGKELGNKHAMDLSGYRKMYCCNKKVRIVYKIVDNKLVVFIVAIGGRNNLHAYKTAYDRI